MGKVDFDKKQCVIDDECMTIYTMLKEYIKEKEEVINNLSTANLLNKDINHVLNIVTSRIDYFKEHINNVVYSIRDDKSLLLEEYFNYESPVIDKCIELINILVEQTK